MMNKLKSKAGMTLVEMLVGLLVLVFLVIGIGVGMDAGSNVHRDAIFESNSASLAGILNTALGDILRHSEDIRVNDGNLKDNADNLLDARYGFVFTSYDYGVRDAYFALPEDEDGESEAGVLRLKNLRDNTEEYDLVNAGAYPNLVITAFDLTYVAPGTNSEGDPGRGGYFNVRYIIQSTEDEELVREVKSVIRLMNAEQITRPDPTEEP